MVVDLENQGCVMAVARMIVDAFMVPMQDADATETSWWAGLRQGIEAFFTVERTRDTILVLLAAGLYYWLARHAKDKMILTPSRVVVAQELAGLRRAGMSHSDITTTVAMLDSGSRNPQDQEEAILAGLAVRRDLIAEATAKRVDVLTGPALLSAAQPVEASLSRRVKAYLDKTALTPEQESDLRRAIARVDHDRADKTWLETRLALRRIRKSQSLGVAGLGLIVLVVILFGNPAIVAFGVLGAVLSRTIAFSRESTDTEQKYNWVILFLVPVVGGLSAYGGVLLIDVMRAWGVLGEVFEGVEFGGESANNPTMAAAFLFGFVERLLDNVASKAADGLGAVMAKENEPGDNDPGDSDATPPTSPAGGAAPGPDDPGEGGGEGDAETSEEPEPVTPPDEAESKPTPSTVVPKAEPAPIAAPAPAAVSLGTAVGAVLDYLTKAVSEALASPKGQRPIGVGGDGQRAPATGNDNPGSPPPDVVTPSAPHGDQGRTSSDAPHELIDETVTDTNGASQTDGETHSDGSGPGDERGDRSH